MVSVGLGSGLLGREQRIPFFFGRGLPINDGVYGVCLWMEYPWKCVSAFSLQELQWTAFVGNSTPRFGWHEEKCRHDGKKEACGE